MVADVTTNWFVGGGGWRGAGTRVSGRGRYAHQETQILNTTVWGGIPLIKHTVYECHVTHWNTQQQ
jgi:hypothetical protein